VQQKDIEKKEKKVAVQGKAPEVHDAFADWRATPTSNGSRNAGLSRSASNLSHGTSHSSGTNGSGNRSRMNTIYSDSSSHGRPPKSSTSGGASVSDRSAKGREMKFQANHSCTDTCASAVSNRVTCSTPPEPQENLA
jgi:hypothetical protein